MRDASWEQRLTCSRLWSVFRRGSRSICAMWRCRSRTGRRNLWITFSTPTAWLRQIGTAADLQQIVVGVSQGKPVYLRDVALSITDGASEPVDYVLYANGVAATDRNSG